MMRKLSIALLAACCALPALAADVGGIKLADKAMVGGQELVLNGAGIRTRAIFKVYVGSLYVPAKTGRCHVGISFKTTTPEDTLKRIAQSLSAVK